MQKTTVNRSDVKKSIAAKTKILAFAGSIRKESYNKKLIKEAVSHARQIGAEVTIIDFKDYPMPFYNADQESDQGMPRHAKAFRDLLIASDAIVISAPEYNSSLPAILKNAIDWASRSEDGKYCRDAFEGKKFAIMSAAPGRGGGVRGLVHLRAIIEAIGGEVIDSQVIVALAGNAFNEKGKLLDPLLKQQLQKQMQFLLESLQILK